MWGNIRRDVYNSFSDDGKWFLKNSRVWLTLLNAALVLRLHNWTEPKPFYSNGPNEHSFRI